MLVKNFSPLAGLCVTCCCVGQVLLHFVNSYIKPRVLYSESKCDEYVCQWCLYISQSGKNNIKEKEKLAPFFMVLYDLQPYACI